MILKEPSEVLPVMPSGMRPPAMVLRATEKHRIIDRETVLGDRTILVLDREARTIKPGPGVTLLKGGATLIGQGDKLSGLVSFGTSFLVRDPSRAMLKLRVPDWSVAIVLWDTQVFEIERKRESDAFAGLESQVARLRAFMNREESAVTEDPADRNAKAMRRVAALA